jgi:hypothetical protein
MLIPPPENPPKNSNRIANISAIMLGAAALITAIGSLLKTPEETGAKATYHALSEQMELNNKATIQNHTDITALGAYVQGVMQSQQQAKVVAVSPAPTSSSLYHPPTSSVDAGAPHFVLPYPTAATTFIIKDVDASYLQSVKPPPPPTASPAPPAYKPKKYADLAK